MITADTAIKIARGTQELKRVKDCMEVLEKNSSIEPSQQLVITIPGCDKEAFDVPNITALKLLGLIQKHESELLDELNTLAVQEAQENPPEDKPAKEGKAV